MCLRIFFVWKRNRGGRIETKTKYETRKIGTKKIRESGWSKNENLSKLFVGGTARHFSHKYMYILHDDLFMKQVFAWKPKANEANLMRFRKVEKKLEVE
jgi:hypothetical protein